MTKMETKWRQWIGPKEPPEYEDPQTILTNDNVLLHCYEYGKNNKKVVLLLHGGLGSSADFGGQILALSKSYRVIAIDTRGHGRSNDSKTKYSYPQFANDATTVMDRLKIQKAHVVGWSDGANTALQLAIHNPDRVGKIVAIGGNTKPSGIRPSVFNDELIHIMISECEKRYREISKTPDRWEKFNEKVVNLWMKSRNVPNTHLAKISAPVLVAAGVYEEAIDENHTRMIADNIPNSKLWLIDNASHFAMWQQVDTVNERITDFLKV